MWILEYFKMSWIQGKTSKMHPCRMQAKGQGTYIIHSLKAANGRAQIHGAWVQLMFNEQ